MFTIDRDTEITPQLMCSYIKLHKDSVTKYDTLEAYYKGKHNILNRVKRADASNNKIVCNHAKYISDVASGYLMGEPIGYKSESGANIDVLTDMLKLSGADVQDMDLAKMQSVFGVAYELIYLNRSGDVKLTTTDPRNSFIVYDNSVELNTVAGCYYYPYTDVKTQKLAGYVCTVMTDGTQYDFKITESFAIKGEITETANLFGMVNLIEVWNNNERQGDFEQLISLIDAYNTLQSDRLNDKEQFVNALMVLKGQTLGDTSGEKTETYRDIKDTGVIEITAESAVEYLTRQFDEASVEVLRKSVENDLHKFSCVPAMTDENFSGTVSGVAMKYKLLGLEQITKIKERYFAEGVKERLKLFKRIAEVKGQGTFDVDDIQIIFTRSLPANAIELSQIIGNLTGIVSQETLLSQIPFVEDPKQEIKRMAEEKKKASEEQFIINPKLEEDDDEDEELLDKPLKRENGQLSDGKRKADQGN